MSFIVKINDIDVSDYVLDCSCESNLFRLEDYQLITPDSAINFYETISDIITLRVNQTVVILSGQSTAIDRVLFSGKIEEVAIDEATHKYKIKAAHDLKNAWENIYNISGLYDAVNLTGYNTSIITGITINGTNPTVIPVLELLTYYLNIVDLEYTAVSSAVSSMTVGGYTLNNCTLDINVLRCAGTNYATSNTNLLEPVNIKEIFKDILLKCGLVCYAKYISGSVKYTFESVLTAMTIHGSLDDISTKKKGLVEIPVINKTIFYTYLYNSGINGTYEQYYTATLYDITSGANYGGDTSWNAVIIGEKYAADNRWLSNVAIGAYYVAGGLFSEGHNFINITVIYKYIREYYNSSLVPSNLTAQFFSGINAQWQDKIKATSKGVIESVTYADYTERVTPMFLKTKALDEDFFNLTLYVRVEGTDPTAEPFDLSTFIYNSENDCSYRLQQGVGSYINIDSSIYYVGYNSSTDLHEYRLLTNDGGSKTFIFTVNDRNDQIFKTIKSEKGYVINAGDKISLSATSE